MPTFYSLQFWYETEDHRQQQDHPAFRADNSHRPSTWLFSSTEKVSCKIMFCHCLFWSGQVSSSLWSPIELKTKEVAEFFSFFLRLAKWHKTCWGSEKLRWGNEAICWGNEMNCWGNEAICWGNEANLMGRWSNLMGEMKQNVLGRCPIDKVHTTPSVHQQCIISASLVHHQRIISASLVHHQRIISA